MNENKETTKEITEEMKEYTWLYNEHNDFICPLTQLVMKDPVCMNDGRSYERDAIEDYFAAGKKLSPLDPSVTFTTNINLNRNLQGAIERFLKENSHLRKHQYIRDALRELKSLLNLTAVSWKDFLNVIEERQEELKNFDEDAVYEILTLFSNKCTKDTAEYSEILHKLLLVFGNKSLNYIRTINLPTLILRLKKETIELVLKLLGDEAPKELLKKHTIKSENFKTPICSLKVALRCRNIEIIELILAALGGAAKTELLKFDIMAMIKNNPDYQNIFIKLVSLFPQEMALNFKKAYEKITKIEMPPKEPQPSTSILNKPEIFSIYDHLKKQQQEVSQQEEDRMQLLRSMQVPNSSSSKNFQASIQYPSASRPSFFQAYQPPASRSYGMSNPSSQLHPTSQPSNSNGTYPPANYPQNLTLSDNNNGPLTGNFNDPNAGAFSQSHYQYPTYFSQPQGYSAVGNSISLDTPESWENHQPQTNNNNNNNNNNIFYYEEENTPHKAPKYN